MSSTSSAPTHSSIPNYISNQAAVRGVIPALANTLPVLELSDKRHENSFRLLMVENDTSTAYLPNSNVGQTIANK